MMECLNISKTLSELFPNFSHPYQSRFCYFFEENSKTEILSHKKESLMSSIIDIDKINKGKENRTTLIIKGIPSIMKTEEVKKLLSSYFNNIEYFYLPEFCHLNKKSMFCFIKLSNSMSVSSIFIGLSTLRDRFKYWKGYDMRSLEIYFAKEQNFNCINKSY